MCLPSSFSAAGLNRERTNNLPGRNYISNLPAILWDNRRQINPGF